MIVRLTREVLDDETGKRDLLYLVQTIVRRNHKITFAGDVTEIPGWVEDNDRQILEDSFAASMIGDTTKHHCDVVKEASHLTHDKVFGMAEAIRYVSLPLIVMVENSSNDSHLILKILDEYTRHKSAPYHDQTLEFGHAGGCNAIEDVLSEKLTQNGGRPKMLRYYIVVDGDRRYPEHKVKKYESLIAFLEQNRIPYHILEKRCMENYLPCEAFPKSRSNNTQWLNAYQALSPRQRDFFNIGGGFREDLSDANKRQLKDDNSNLRELMREEIREFYADVSDTNLHRLAGGYVIKAFKETFPKGFTTVTRESLDKIQQHQDDPSELGMMAQEIVNLL